MAPSQATRNIPIIGGGRPSYQKERTRPQGISKERPQLRRSPRIQTLPKNTIVKPLLVSTTRNDPSKKVENRKRKREQSQESEPHYPSPLKRLRKSPLEDTICENQVLDLDEEVEEFSWPKEHFRPGPNMSYLLAIKRSSSLCGRNSEFGSTGSDQKPREIKSAAYARPSYESFLANKGSFMGKSGLGITDASKKLCQTLLNAEQLVPLDTLFRDDLFDETCESIRARNEALVVRDISPLICPSAQVLRIFSGDKHLKLLNESVNEGWNCARPVCGPRPQPDYSLGFGRSAFTNDQLEKLAPFIGEGVENFTSLFMATWQMYFPFLTCEVKCGGTAALDIADRQNAHSMTLAVRGIVELFRLVDREKELHREILAFSISHDHETVRIYGHYPIIDRKETTFYRYPIRKFDFTELEGKEKWTSYMFTKSVYNIWMPSQLKRICSVLDILSSDVIEASLDPGESGLSQGLGSHNISSIDTQSLLEDNDIQSNRADTSDTSLSQKIGVVAKKARKRDQL